MLMLMLCFSIKANQNQQQNIKLFFFFFFKKKKLIKKKKKDTLKSSNADILYCIAKFPCSSQALIPNKPKIIAILWHSFLVLTNIMVFSVNYFVIIASRLNKTKNRVYNK